jgi:uncharacterized protein
MTLPMTSPAAPSPLPVLTDSEGELAVRHGRRTLEALLGAPDGSLAGAPGTALPPRFGERRGVFVTLRTEPDGELRGCIGFPLPHLALGRAIGEAAVAAASEDPRFPPLGPEELRRVTLEVSILSPPEPLDSTTPEQLPSQVRVGVDGLILEAEHASGLLLPQVALEQHWSAEQFLAATCEKAGLRRSRWREPGARLFRFQSAVFAEEHPGGPVRRRLG